MRCGPKPSARSEPLAQRGARIRGRVLFGYFLLHEQEKVTRPPGWRSEKHTDVSRFSRQHRKPKAKNWIPASAGMTTPEHHPHPTLPLKGRAKEIFPNPSYNANHSYLRVL